MQVTKEQLGMASSILKIWAYGKQQGYVFISSGFRSNPHKKCDPGTWQDKPFKWPEEKDLILPFVENLWEQDRDAYWCAHKFSQPSRKQEFALPSVSVHSDLDETLPPKDLSPTLLWESSPKRYAAIWLLNEEVPVEQFETACRDFNYSIEADKNCWTVTKVLRIPGGVNRKYADLPISKILKFINKKYGLKDFSIVELPEPNTEVEDLDDIQVHKSQIELIKQYQEVLSKDMILKLMMTDDEVATKYPDRSGALFALEHELYKTGIPVEDIISILKESGFNKYRDRRDEDRRWEAEFDKVTAEVGPIKAVVAKERPQVLSVIDRMSRNIEPPGWLIEGFWPQGSHGIVAGPPKSYKSILIMEMGISIASGTALFGKFKVPKPEVVLYIQNENPDWSVDDRLRKMLSFKGLDKIVETTEENGHIKLEQKDIPFYSVDYNLNLNDEQDKEWLIETIKEYKPKFVILDSLYMMMSGIDENSMKEVSPMMNWLLHSIVRPLHCAVAVLHHWNKNSKGDRSTRMLGSQAFRAWVDSQISADIEDDERHIVNFYREFPRSYGTLPPVQVQFNMGEPGSTLYRPVVITEASTSPDVSNEDIRQVILERLNDQPRSKRDLLNGFGSCKVAFENELQQLVNEGIVTLKQKLYHYVGKEEE